jgi:SM-20-related protein
METLFKSLETQGWACADDLLPANLVSALTEKCQKSWQEGLFREAHIGRGTEKSRHSEIRGDSILWLDSSPAALGFLEWAAQFRRELNQRYFLGLQSEEFHFARYPVGKGYQKHMDQHRGQSQRKISLVLYLNPQWSENDGGELVLYSPEDEKQMTKKILPRWGRLVVFRSDLIPHEVLPCIQIRWSLTGWFRTDF